MPWGTSLVFIFYGRDRSWVDSLGNVWNTSLGYLIFKDQPNPTSRRSPRDQRHRCERVNEVGRSKLLTHGFRGRRSVCHTLHAEHKCLQSPGTAVEFTFSISSSWKALQVQVLTLIFDDWLTFGNWKPRLQMVLLLQLSQTFVEQLGK